MNINEFDVPILQIMYFLQSNDKNNTIKYLSVNLYFTLFFKLFPAPSNRSDFIKNDFFHCMMYCRSVKTLHKCIFGISVIEVKTFYKDGVMINT